MKKRMAALLGTAIAIATVNAAQATMLLPSPAADAAKALKRDNATRAGARLQFVRSRRGRHRRGRHHRRRRHRGYHGSSGFWPGAAFGAVVGGILSSQPRYYGGYSAAVRWCMRHYRSYDPGSRTYLGYDGRRHSCP